jgi:putative nucleotidyltransferase with HDIG domain
MDRVLEALSEMALARTRDDLARRVARLARAWSGAPGAEWLAFDAEARLAPEESTLAGRCALLLEPVEGQARVEGVEGPALAFPGLLHGALQGVLLAAGPPADRLALEVLARLAAAVQPWVAAAEDWRAWAASTGDLLVRALEALEGCPGHTARVARLADEMAQELGLPAEARARLWRAAQCHDLGKLVLAGSSSDEIRRLHAQAGAELLRASPATRSLAELVEAHHGSHSAPLEAWILALAEEADEGYPWPRPLEDARLEGCPPEALEALGRLAESGRLGEILQSGRA